ncbi:ABC transporter ATP-binding protein [Paenibacillus gallinarum]|uniref:ABC transporter ATP-binding protein n=1 Tax=Paenibacillus gallinarum TaxID=2762232 RepID=A0ABR8T446_9BACL|nr:ABC transporter ATP-binding protein [Paenibacillus gallinarum]MBD7970526.1 ABC transporter ATP-binding protein [Paenibacillus gallinarum]
MIEVSGVTKLFETEAAVNQLSLTIRKGSIFGLLGSNGAGKTTLLKTIAGIYQADQGSVNVEGAPVYENNALKQRIIFMSDIPYFFPQTSLDQMAVFYKRIYPSWSDERYQQLDSVFKLDRKRKLHRMSKGMQRQAAFWLALSCMPDILLLDEPIDGLDPVMRRQVKNLLFQEAAERELTVIISSHNLREIEDLCDHVGIMHHGQLIVEKDLDDLKADTHKIQVAFRDHSHEESLANNVRILHGEKRGSVETFIVKGNEKEVRKVFEAYQPYLLDVLPLTLEEIFIYEMEDVGYDIHKVVLQ